MVTSGRDAESDATAEGCSPPVFLTFCFPCRDKQKKIGFMYLMFVLVTEGGPHQHTYPYTSEMYSMASHPDFNKRQTR